MRTTHDIPKARIEELAAKIERLNKVAAKLELPPITMTEGEETLRPHPGDAHKPEAMRRHIPFVTVTITGEEPVLKGYVFRATLLHTYDADAGTIIKAVPSYRKDIPEQYRHAEANCDHCGWNRKRKKTYVLEHEDGTWVQVGSTCIGDFLAGAHDPERAARFCESLADIAIACRALGERVEGIEPVFELERVLAVTNLYIRRHGWMSKAQARRGGIRSAPATAVRVSDNLFGDATASEQHDDCEDGRFEREHVPNEADWDLARKVAEWGGALGDRNDLNDYLHNLSAVGSAGFVTQATLGLAASMPQAYNRAMDELSRPAMPRRPSGPGRFLGAKGDKVALRVKVIRCSTFNGRYGKGWAVGMVDGEGNEAVWFASVDPCCETGNTYQVTGTVQGTGKFRGRNQTKLTRCKLTDAA